MWFVWKFMAICGKTKIKRNVDLITLFLLLPIYSYPATQYTHKAALYAVHIKQIHQQK